MAMEDVIRMNQEEHVLNEKNILRSISHPFLISLTYSTMDTRFLYLLFPFIPGGELFSYLRTMRRFPVTTAMFYTAEVVSALDYLHSLHIIYRDIKLENLLLDSKGHLKIVDFGFAKTVRERTWTMCGTPEYIAPEIILNKGYTMSVDWWALGVLVYEMVVGYPPFRDKNIIVLYEKILEGVIEWPKEIVIQTDVRDFVSRLLTREEERLGGEGRGVVEVMEHRWLEHLDWGEVRAGKLKPPIIPQLLHQGDSGNYQEYMEELWWEVEELTMEEREVFRGFES